MPSSRLRPAPSPRLRRRALAVALVVSLTLAACSPGDGGDEAGDEPSGPAADATSVPDDGVLTSGEALPALGRLGVSRAGSRPAIVDEQGREVLLRGTNLNSLGDFFQADPSLAPTRPPTDDDWDQMAAHGFSVVRLVVSWSALQPQRGQVDLTYVARIQEAVQAAASRRMYTVIDMHQDAWSRFVSSPPDVRCPEGTEPTIGGDGAPEWATITDDADTCRPKGDRTRSPAVEAAFRAFYENRDGIRDDFATAWQLLASIFAQDPAVAGYDLLNEPEVVSDPSTSERQYTELVDGVVASIRQGEAAAGGFSHLVFLEPMRGFPLPGTMPADGSPPDDQVVFAPHVTTEAAGPQAITVEQGFDVADSTADARGWPLWIGEHEVSGTGADAVEASRRVARAQDDHLVGGAEWQWRQWCGDPQSIGAPARPPVGDQTQLNDVGCPDDEDLGPNVELLAVAGRAYPRVAPGRLTALSSDPDTGEMRVEGTVIDDLAGGMEMILWVPGDDRPVLTGDGVGDADTTAVPGGWYVRFEVADSPYRVELG